MGWLIELLFEAVKEKCSQFIIDMMEIASGMFTEILSCDLNLFEELFGVAGDLYKNAVLPIAVALLLVIVIWQLYKSMFGKMGASSEDPVELVFRSCFCLFMIVFAKDIVNYILDIAGSPYEWVVGTAVTVDSFSQYVSTAEAVVGALGVDAISIQLLLLVMQFVVAWNYFKMLFILAERYVLLGVFSYTSPLAFATGASKATNNILASWSKMFGGQVMIIILDAWCLKMFLSAYGNLMASSYGFTKFFAATMCLIGFCKITGKLDSYMASLGVNLGRTGGGLSGLGALMMAGRMFRPGGASHGGGEKENPGHMSFGTGKSIPLGRSGGSYGADGMSGTMAGTMGGSDMAVHGMDNPAENMPSAAAMEGEEDWKNDFGGFGPENSGMESQNLLFGLPDDETMDTPAGISGETDNMEGAFGGELETGRMGEPDGGPFGYPEEETGVGSMGMEISGDNGNFEQMDSGQMDSSQMDSGPFGTVDMGDGIAGVGGMQDDGSAIATGLPVHASSDSLAQTESSQSDGGQGTIPMGAADAQGSGIDSGGAETEYILSSHGLRPI